MKVKNKDRIKRQNKKTIRSEMVNMLVWTSIMTMLLVGGGLSVIIFQWSSIALIWISIWKVWKSSLQIICCSGKDQ